MNPQPFGKTGLHASEVGLGCWQLDSADWGEVDDRLALDILGAAVDAGVNFFDTPPTSRAVGAARRSSGSS